MGRAAFLLTAHKADEKARLEKEAREAAEEQEDRGWFGGVGKLVGSIGLPMLVAAVSGPIGWAAAAGWAAAGSAIGQKAGRKLGEGGDTKISKGKFFKGEVDDIQADIDAMGKDDGDILKEALWDGAMAGAMSIGKEGLKAIGSKVVTKLPAGAQDFAAKKMGYITETGAADVAAMNKAADGAALKDLFTTESMWGESMGGFKPTSDSWIGKAKTAKATALYDKQFAEQASKFTEAYGKEIEPGVFQKENEIPFDEEFPGVSDEMQKFMDEEFDWEGITSGDDNVYKQDSTTTPEAYDDSGNIMMPEVEVVGDWEETQLKEAYDNEVVRMDKDINIMEEESKLLDQQLLELDNPESDAYKNLTKDPTKKPKKVNPWIIDPPADYKGY